MRSQLTRNVYRRLLAGQGLLQPCPAAQSHHALLTFRPRRPTPPSLLRRPSSRRTFFGLFQKAPREVKEPGFEPGYPTLLQFRSLEVDGVRLPPRDDLLQGFRDFFKYKIRNHKAPNKTQAFLAWRLLKHLAESDGAEGTSPLTVEDLREARDAVLLYPTGHSRDHIILAKELAQEIQKRTATGFMTAPGYMSQTYNDFKQFIAALSRFGAAREATTFLNKYCFEEHSGQPLPATAVALWTLVLEGLAREGMHNKLVKQVEKFESLRLPYSPTIHQIMTCYFAQRDQVDETKEWFAKPISPSDARPTPETYSQILALSLRKNLKSWSQTVFEELRKSDPSKLHWDVIFQWQFLAMGQGVEQIKEAMAEQIRRSSFPGKEWNRPDATTINFLVEAAAKKQGPFLAERFISLSHELNIEPNWKTYVLQMDYRIDAKDLAGAHAVYHMLETGVIPVFDDQDLPVLNKYIRALCDVKQPNIGRILDITSYIEQRNATLEPETVVSLCWTFLKNDQPHDVIDTLSLHTMQFSLEERAKVCQALVDYCLNKKYSTARVWDGYSLLRQFFPETEPAQRIQLMDAFFERKRPDMACYVFGHMRSHSNEAQHPTTDIYIRCLEGLGRYPDLESLKMVHNMLKMDTKIRMDTRLYNALMIAYVGCEEAETAWDFWTEINKLPEGPSYNSLALVFRVCEALPYGDRKARPIWQKLERLDVDMPPHVFWSYCGAIAGAGSLEEVKRLIQGMDASVGYPPSPTTLAVVYNALPGQSRRADFEKWAALEYPELWARVESMGRKLTIDGVDQFKLVRNLQA